MGWVLKLLHKILFLSTLTMGNHGWKERLNTRLIAVCMYRLVIISIKRSETAQKSTLEIQDKIQSEIFLSDGQKFLFFRLNFVSDCICLRLNLSWTEFCLRLNFVLDYILQLYFVCNLLISKLVKFSAKFHLANDWICFVQHKLLYLQSHLQS